MKNHFYGRNVVPGSFENCTKSVIHEEIRNDTVRQKSCLSRNHILSIVPNAIMGHSCDIMFGIPSQAGGDSLLWRKAICNTWISNLDTKVQAYFVVSGVWEDIGEEFERHQDMIQW